MIFTRQTNILPTLQILYLKIMNLVNEFARKICEEFPFLEILPVLHIPDKYDIFLLKTHPFQQTYIIRVSKTYWTIKDVS